MDYKQVFTGKSAAELKSMVDNWKARKERLTDAYGQPIDGMANKKAEKLIFRLVDQMVSAALAYMAVEAGEPIPDFPKKALPISISVNPVTMEIVEVYPPEHVRQEQRN